jgi:hypothetical protein
MFLLGALASGVGCAEAANESPLGARPSAVYHDLPIVGLACVPSSSPSRRRPQARNDPLGLRQLGERGARTASAWPMLGAELTGNRRDECSQSQEEPAPVNFGIGGGDDDA